ncbi:peptidoglycan-binding protein [Actinorhabdospora filicis]|uniref:Peptidoglycan-binding protein n=1 Tax=Actinorhabdospora filicis TaxID=1785913 RepID=A0A9W6W6X1_9ACTN|nr:peptidoglycan-binding protein [Actinorhabdospora filicis]
MIATAVLAVGAATAAATGFDLFTGDDPGQAAPDLPASTATVDKGTIVDSRNENGTLGYGDTLTLGARLSGTVTALPDSGAIVKRGQALASVDNGPLVLMYGDLPAYRALSAGTKGADVKQFERNLAALGYDGFTVDETYSWQTALAVREWQKDLGLTGTGVVELGRVVFAHGEVRVDALKAAPGDQSGPGTALLTYSGTEQVVTVDLDVAQRRLAVADAKVKVRLPNGRTAAATIAEVRTVIVAGETGQDPKTKVRLRVTVDDPKDVEGLDQAAVKVGFAAEKHENVLTVPIGALVVLGDGRYGVQAVENGAVRTIPVETGLFADGRVEVSGDGLAEGMTVGVAA